MSVPDQPHSLQVGKMTLAATWEVNIPKLDVGPEKSFVFWIWNSYLERFVNVTAPESSTFQDPSRSERRVPLVQPEGNLQLSLLPANRK